ncbi:MAG: hypothetical protein JXK07_06750 [Spirochaetes bacterium]|nr:hypothetical protein [Spirochaetota bacterium]MBN2771346.1 hypothetical protein [Spirochaetota bacterium]
MLNILKIISSILVLFILLAVGSILVSCSDEASAFYDSSNITIFSPEDESDVSGDIKFTFSEFYSLYLNVAIFSEKVQINTSNQISNWQDCVGGIHNSMPGFVRGQVFLSDMRDFSMDDMSFTGENSPELEVGKTYYWLVWGLDDYLTEIYESSPIYQFTYMGKNEKTILLDLPEHWQKVSDNIEFNYSSFSSPFLVLAIFDAKPLVSSDGEYFSITMDNCLGGIGPGMSYYDRGSAYLLDMCKYSQTADAFNESEPLVLQEGNDYYWMVWGYNSDNTQIIEISAERIFSYLQE